MLSTLAIVSIFLQIFTSGITLAGSYSFFVRYIQSKKRYDLYLSLIFISFSIFTVFTVISQMTYTLGDTTNMRFALHRIISLDLIAGALFIAYFIKEKFGYREGAIFNVFLIGTVVEMIMIIRSPINLIENISGLATDPGVHFLSALPPELFWVILWLIMGLRFIFSARASQSVGERKIFNLSGISSILVPISFLFSLYYAKTGESYFLVGTWAIYLISAVGLFLGNIILPTEDIAKFPLSYFRTKILYKLLLIFILLITILLEASTIATMNLNQISLLKEIKGGYLTTAKNIADKIGYMGITGGKINKQFIRDTLEEQIKGKRYIYVVSKDGKLFAGPDPKEEGRDLSNLEVVRKVIDGKEGSHEYLSEFFEKVESKHVIGAYAPVPKAGLGVIVEEPKWDAYSEIRLVATNTLIFVIVGIILTVSVGIFFAKSIENSIKAVITGTEAVSKGDLTYKIKVASLDEIGQLANAFNKMTQELDQSQKHLVESEKLASLGTMAAGMAHEIKNPLVSLRTFTQLLPQRFQDEEFRNKFATVVPMEIDKINKIAESLLRFGRPHKPELTQVNVNEILEEILALFDNEARKNNVKVTTKFAELPKITGDPGQLSQAFVNIILNAIQAMPSGGELTVKTDVGEKIILAHAKGAQEEEEDATPIPVVFAEISDTGMGIPEENIKSIFDPFFTTKEVGGTGMGLPITLRIIQEHNGDIKVDSKMGKGTKFLITLPQQQENKT